MIRKQSVVAVFALCLAIAGCGGSQFHPVTGRLVYPDGSPVTGMEGGQVVFEGTGTDGRAYSSVGIIDAEGRFKMTAEKSGDGAPPGKNRVAIMPLVINPDQPVKRVLDMKYEDLETSNIEVEIKPGQPNDIELKVEPKRGR